MAKEEASVEELVSMIERGYIRLPEMQRRYVWRATRVRDLLDSLYRGYPSGAILIWDTDDDVPLQESAVQQQQNPYQNTRLLLDGQQRLTSLAAVIRGQQVEIRGRKRSIELLFNLEHPDKLAVVTEVDEKGINGREEDLIDDETDSTEDDLQKRMNRMTFVLATRKLEQLPQWVNVTDVFKSSSDAQFLRSAGVDSFDNPNFDRYSKRLERLRGIKNYSYRIDVLERGLSYDEVTEIFVRVNSLGAKLRSSDLALAQITAKWRGALKEFQGFQKTCARDGFNLDLGIHLKNLVVFSTGQSRFHTIGGVSTGTLKKGWEESCLGMEFALNFLKSNAEVEGPALLSSPFLLITLAYYAHKREYQLTPIEERHIRYWALITNAKGRYSRGSSETILDQDLAVLRNGGGAQELTDRLRQQVGRLDITPDELAGRNQRSALFKTMFLAFHAARAKDWHSSLIIAVNHSGAQHKLQFHHIFPKAILKRSNTSSSETKEYSRSEVDDIANLCFISGRTNRKISDKSPDQYIPSVIEELGRSGFEAQCIPTDPELLKRENYREFLKERRARIAERLNQFLEEERSE